MLWCGLRPLGGCLPHTIVGELISFPIQLSPSCHTIVPRIIEVEARTKNFISILDTWNGLGVGGGVNHRNKTSEITARK